MTVNHKLSQVMLERNSDQRLSGSVQMDELILAAKGLVSVAAVPKLKRPSCRRHNSRMQACSNSNWRWRESCEEARLQMGQYRAWQHQTGDSWDLDCRYAVSTNDFCKASLNSLLDNSSN